MSGPCRVPRPVGRLHVPGDVPRLRPRRPVVIGGHCENAVVVLAEQKPYLLGRPVLNDAGVPDGVVTVGVDDLHIAPSRTAVVTSPHHDVDLPMVELAVHPPFTERKRRSPHRDDQRGNAIRVVAARSSREQFGLSKPWFAPSTASLRLRDPTRDHTRSGPKSLRGTCRITPDRTGSRIGTGPRATSRPESRCAPSSHARRLQSISWTLIFSVSS